MKVIPLIFKSLFISVLLFNLYGCHTVKGMGQDIESLGDDHHHTTTVTTVEKRHVSTDD